MTVPTTSNKVIATGNGVSTVFPFTFGTLPSGDLVVTLFDLDGIEYIQAEGGDYTVQDVGEEDGGSVTFAVPPTDGWTVLIQRVLPETQPTDLKNQGSFYPRTIERMFDRVTMLVQQLAERIGSALTLPPQVENVSTQLPAPEPSTLFGWNPAGTAIQNFPLSTIATSIAYGNKNYQTFVGTGAQVNFILSQNPGSLGNLDISIDGVTQVPGADYTYSGTTLTFASAPDNGAAILVRYDVALPIGSANADMVNFLAAGTGAVSRDTQEKLRETAVSVKDYGALGNGVSITSAVTIASGSAALTVAGANFQSSDAGKPIAVRGAGVAGATLYGTIVSRSSPTQVTLSANASTSLVASSQKVVYGSDDWQAFQRAINALGADGGTILVPSAIYMMHGGTPSSGAKSIQWDIRPGAIFDGSLGGSTSLVAFPRANTNESIVPFGPFLQLRTDSLPEGANTLASTAGLFEALQPAGHDGNAVALYAGARSAAVDGLLWASNILAQADAGFGGHLHGIELDINCFTADTDAIIKGLGISGIGDGVRKADVAIEIQHGVGWKRGIDILNCDLGIQIRTSVAQGIGIFAPAGGAGTAVSAKQKANGNTSIHLERFTDSSPAGLFLDFRNAANSASVFAVDVAGGVVAGGIVNATGFSTTGTTDTFNMALRFAAPTTAAGVVGLGNGTTNTVGAAGGAAALPASPVGYWILNIGGTNYKIPFYNS